jgi:hypothetical protein
MAQRERESARARASTAAFQSTSHGSACYTHLLTIQSPGGKQLVALASALRK